MPNLLKGRIEELESQLIALKDILLGKDRKGGATEELKREINGKFEGFARDIDKIAGDIDKINNRLLGIENNIIALAKVARNFCSFDNHKKCDDIIRNLSRNDIEVTTDECCTGCGYVGNKKEWDDNIGCPICGSYYSYPTKKEESVKLSNISFNIDLGSIQIDKNGDLIEFKPSDFIREYAKNYGIKNYKKGDEKNV